MKLQCWNSIDCCQFWAMKQEKQPRHASHSHNYYFIKKLPPLACALWQRCGEAGMVPEEERMVEGGSEGSGCKREEQRIKKGALGGRKHALIWVISQSAQGQVTEPLHLIWAHICRNGPQLIALIIPDTEGRMSWRSESKEKCVEKKEMIGLMEGARRLNFKPAL